MNVFKRILFHKNPRRLPQVGPSHAALWNEDGDWKQDVGNGPEPLAASNLFNISSYADLATANAEEARIGVLFYNEDTEKYEVTSSAS